MTRVELKNISFSRRGRFGLTDWDDVFKSVKTLELGEAIQVRVPDGQRISTFQSTVHKNASRRGIKVSVRSDRDDQREMYIILKGAAG